MAQIPFSSSLTLTFISMSNLWHYIIWLRISRKRGNVAIVMRIGSHVTLFVMKWRHCECCTPWPWDELVISETSEWYCKIACYDFCRGWYSPSMCTIMNAVLRDFDRHFQRSNVFMLRILLQTLRMSAADLPRLARPRPWSCSCFSLTQLSILKRMLFPAVILVAISHAGTVVKMR